LSLEPIHIVIVNFSTTVENQDQALAKIGDYVAQFLSQQAGFLHSRLHASLDGNSIVHYAEWSSASHFQAAAQLARAHPDLPALMAFEPSASAYTIKRSFPEN